MAMKGEAMTGGLPEGDLTLGDGRILHRDKGFRWLGNPNQILGACRWVGKGALAIIASIDRTPKGDLRHVSLSYPGHNPSWRDIKLVRDALFPETIDVMMVLPRARDYINLHEHCFHLWQTPTEWGIL